MDARSQQDPAGNAEPSVLDALVQTSFTVIGAVTVVAARHDLSLTLLRVLAILRDRTPTMSELAAYLGLDRSTVTGLVDRAVRRGLLRKEADGQDRRSSRVALTEAGHALARACTDDIAQQLAPLIERLAPAQRAELAQLLHGLGVVA